jgi:hypothetical protein
MYPVFRFLSHGTNVYLGIRIVVNAVCNNIAVDFMVGSENRDEPFQVGRTRSPTLSTGTGRYGTRSSTGAPWWIQRTTTAGREIKAKDKAICGKKI